EPLARDEDRRADVEAERVVLEGRAVAIPHQEADQALVRLVHLRLAAAERHARRVDDGEGAGHGGAEPHRTLGEYPGGALRGHVGRDRHGRSTLAARSDGTSRERMITRSRTTAREATGTDRSAKVPKRLPTGHGVVGIVIAEGGGTAPHPRVGE